MEIDKVFIFRYYILIGSRYISVRTLDIFKPVLSSSNRGFYFGNITK
jgi:hypothetical protein